jgi:hypothetical protein
MVLKTRMVGTRIPEQMYSELEKRAGNNKTIGDVVKEAIESYLSTRQQITGVPKKKVSDIEV